MAIIKAEKLIHKYDDILALDQVNLDLGRGQHIVILGANGSGKSTLVRHFNALLAPDSGQVLVMGLDTSQEENTWTIRQNVAMVFQNPENQIVGASVEDDIVFGMENIGLDREVMGERLEEVLDLMQLTNKRRQEPHNLSGGQKQRLAIAGILAMEPKVIIFDEATSMLDPRGRAEVQAVIEVLAREKDLLIIQISHDMEEALLADYVYVMDAGTIVLAGSPDEIFRAKNGLDAYNLEKPWASNFYQLYLGARAESRGEKTLGSKEKIIEENKETVLDMKELVEALCE